MYSIAICDDEIFTCSKIEQIVLRYSDSHNIKLEIVHFYKGETLVEELRREKYFDIIFMDVDLLTMSGVDVAKKVRNEFSNESTQIIYISSKSSYAMQLFKTRPMDFLVKPLSEKELEEVFLQALKAINQGNQVFEFSRGRVDFRIPYKGILYFRSIGRKIHMVLDDKKDVEFYARLNKLIGQLPPWEFLQVHKSYVVNCNNVVKYAYETIEMKNGEIISVSQARRREVREQLLMRKREKRHGY